MDVNTSGKRDTSVQKAVLKDTLILQFESEGSDLRSQVYQETLKFISENLASTDAYTFKTNQDLMKYLKKNKFTTVISTNEISSETACLIKGLGVVQILIGSREDLLEISDIILDPLVLKGEKYLVGLRYLLPDVLNKFSAELLADEVGVSPEEFTLDVNHNDAETELLDIAKLFQKLDWDSQFFGVNIGFISCLRLTPNIEKLIKKFIRKEKIDMLEYLCNCHDKESVETSEKNGYSFVDMRLTFERLLNKDINVDLREGYEIRKAQDADRDILKKVATDIYIHSRYYFDTNFDRDKVIEFYVNWVEKALDAQYDDFAYVLVHKSMPIGFCTIKKMRVNAVAIGLFGLSAEYQGKGLAKYMLNKALKNLKEEENIAYVEVVTQGRNYEAQRLYQKCGFVTKLTELWYHKWFH